MEALAATGEEKKEGDNFPDGRLPPSPNLVRKLIKLKGCSLPPLPSVPPHSLYLCCLLSSFCVACCSHSRSWKMHYTLYGTDSTTEPLQRTVNDQLSFQEYTHTPDWNFGQD